MEDVHKGFKKLISVFKSITHDRMDLFNKGLISVGMV